MPKTTTGRAGAGFALVLLVLAFGAAPASAAGNRSYAACAGAVISDWLVHEPNVAGHYPLRCYREALQQLSSYSDVQGYSNAPDDIRRALEQEILYLKKHPQTTTSSTTTNASGGSGPSAGPSGGNGPSGPSGNGGGKSFITKAFDSVGPGNAQSIPLPLLVLAGLAILLVLAALGTWIAKRVQARRLPPASARAPQEQ